MCDGAIHAQDRARASTVILCDRSRFTYVVDLACMLRTMGRSVAARGR